MRGARVSSAYESLRQPCQLELWSIISPRKSFRIRSGRAFAKALTDKPKLLRSGAAHPRGVTMRDCWKNRRGYDRVLMTVAATFLTVSANSAFAQSDTPRNSAAELAIDAAVPRPEPANVPPPTASDFKLDTPPDTAKTDANKTDANKAAEQAAPATKPADVATAPISEPTKVEPAKEEANKADPSKNDAAKNDAETAAPAPPAPPAATAASPEPAKEPVKAVSNVPAEDQT